jgi:hypothetical protein
MDGTLVVGLYGFVRGMGFTRLDWEVKHELT